MRYELSAKGVFICDCPDNTTKLDDWTTITPPSPCYRPRFVGERLPTGEWIGEWVDDGQQPLPFEHLSMIERQWRDVEIARSDRELFKVQDGMGVGTVTAWREYRCSLRDWPIHADFPDSTKRPVAPDA